MKMDLGFRVSFAITFVVLFREINKATSLDYDENFPFPLDKNATCLPEEFSCGDDLNTCIPATLFCDLTTDCPNNADELEYNDEYLSRIGGVFCRSTHTYNPCILTNHWICDGVKGQCVNDTDEICWESPNGLCYVHHNFRCDGFSDCLDGEDEEGCSYLCAAPPGDFDDLAVGSNLSKIFFRDSATNNTFLSLSERLLCNGISDCADDMDECFIECPNSSLCKKTFQDCGGGILSEITLLGRCKMCDNGSASYYTNQICDGKYDCADGSDEMDCPDFTCRNGKTIPGHKECNKIDECGDGSDECSCSRYYESFICNNGRCVSAKYKCDGTDHCGDSSDECDHKCHARNKFMCFNGKCIARSRFCDGVDNCGDNSDELPQIKDLSRFPQYTLCSNPYNNVKKTCALTQESWFCDLSDHCVDRADECGSECNHSFHCDADKCLPIEAFCDGNVDCIDGSDEAQLEGHNPSLISCKNRVTDSEKICGLKEDNPWICDGVEHCSGRTDECSANCKHSYCCQSGECIRRKQLCDGTPDCQDRSDENVQNGFRFLCIRSKIGLNKRCKLPINITYDDTPDCDRDADIGGDIHLKEILNRGDITSMLTINEVISERFFLCIGEKLIIPGHKLCDGVFDCELFSDECLCDDAPELCRRICIHKTLPLDPLYNECLRCKTGEFSCEDESKCITSEQICDGVRDCASGMDERCKYDEEPCHNGNCREFLCQDGTLAVQCDGKPDCYNFLDECQESCRDNGTVYPKYCDHVTEQRIDLAVVRMFSCGNAFKQLDGLKVCDGVRYDCEDKIDELDCPNRIYCNGTEHLHDHAMSNLSSYSGVIHVAKSQICDGKIDCIDGEDELNCEQHFYCESRHPLFVPKIFVTDGKIDCSDGSDECPAVYLDSDAFASRQNMLKSPFLRVVVWVMGIVSTLGNITVLAETFHESFMSKRKFSTKRPFAKVHHTLVINLATADLLMGIYLLILGSKTMQTNGSYCKEDKSWRTSSTCEALGTLTVISSVTSILILTLMTSYRLYAVLRPFHCHNFDCHKTIIFSFVAWIVALLLGFIPRLTGLSDYFVSDLWVKTNRLIRRDVINKAELTRRLGLVMMYENNVTAPLQSASTVETGHAWRHVSHLVRKTFGKDFFRGEFGYYSAHSVCLPKLFVDTSDVAWSYSLGLVSFISLAFLFVLTAYIAIYAKSQTGSRKNARQIQIYKKISYLVASDVVCWVPICVMAYLTLGRVALSDQVYAVSAIVLLPINSALNPLLYSNVIQKLLSKIKGKLARIIREKKRNYRNDSTTGIFANVTVSKRRDKIYYNAGDATLKMSLPSESFSQCLSGRKPDNTASQLELSVYDNVPQ